MRIAVIVASVRDGRFGPHVANWVHKRLIDADVDVDVIDLADLTFPANMAGHPDVAHFAGRIERADGVIIVTPEYNHSYPGPLKVAIDAVKTHWRAKPVAFVSYGGLSGGLRAVEALRIVLGALHTVTITDTVSLHNPWGKTIEWPEDALGQLVRNLLWWANALSVARRLAPYPA